MDKQEQHDIINDPKLAIVKSMDMYFNHQMMKTINSSEFNVYTLIQQNDTDRLYYTKLFQQSQHNNLPILQHLKLSPKETKSVACLLGLAIGDALGASTQFQPFQKHRQNPWVINQGFKDIERCVQERRLIQRHGQIGIWTDDCSMALCMAYSLLVCKYEFKPKHMRYMFILWLRHGLGNGGRRHSIGLGGNISISMHQFMNKQDQYTQEGNKFNNGNGSLMRLAPIPITFRANPKKAEEYAYLQSKMTHNGEQAAECCRLLSGILVNLINRSEDQDWKSVLNRSCLLFNSHVQSVNFLAHSIDENQEHFKSQCEDEINGSQFRNFNKSRNDRKWNWKSPQFTYSRYRSGYQPGYVGSYCMDALAMSLHIIWHTNTFYASVVWAINMGGDCDTVGAITGQLAGAIYGVNDQVIKLYSQMKDVEHNRFQILLTALKITKLNYGEDSKEVIDEVTKESVDIVDDGKNQQEVKQNVNNNKGDHSNQVMEQE